MTIYTNVAVWPQAQPNTTYDHYGLRMTGMLLPPVTGTYYFRSVADDSVQFNLSPLACMAAATTIIKAEGGTGCAACGMTSGANLSPGIDLVGGYPYSFEILMVDGTGSDYITNLWLIPGSESWTCIDSANLALTVNPDMVDVATIVQPTNATVLEGRGAGFTALGQTAAGGMLCYQWQYLDTVGGNWTDIPGATNATYNTGYVCNDLHTRQYRAVIWSSLVNELVTRSNITDVATLFVLPDDESRIPGANSRGQVSTYHF